MWHAAPLTLLLASCLAPSLQAQRAGAFHGFAKSSGHAGHATRPAFSKSQFPGHFHRRDGLGAFLSPYFLPNDESSWSEGPGAEPVHAETAPEEFYAPRQRPPADPQVIEIPGAANQREKKTPLPAIIVLLNGERLETRRFMLTVTSLSVNIDRRERVIPLEEVDLGATTAANRERGINLRIPADSNEISLSF